jgi:aspartokinase
MSDTSIISTVSAYNDDSKNSSSFFNRYWFHIIAIVLLLIILIISSILIYVLYKQTQRDQERRRIQNEFKQKHGLANKVLDLIRKDGIVTKWFKKNKGSTVTIFKQLMNDMVETIFDQ